MATSSINKTFTLRNKAEVTNFMRLFEKSVQNPPKLEKSSIRMSTPEQVTELVNAVRKMQLFSSTIMSRIMI